MNRLLPLVFLAACAPRLAIPPSPAPRASTDPQEIRADVRWLADDAREGRATGTKGADESATWLAARWAALRLDQPFKEGDAPSFVQPFDVVTGTAHGPRTALASGSETFAVGRDFEPFSFSDEGTVEAPLVFAGHGITAPELGWDDYAGLDVKGRIVVVLAHEPGERDVESPFRKPSAVRFRELRYKAMNAREHGAKAILIAPDVHQHDIESEAAPALRGSARGASAGILAASLTAPAARRLLGEELYSIARAMNEHRQPQSRVFQQTAALTVELVKLRTTGRNVCGVVRGSDSKLAGEAVVVGAHYDHLGHGGEGSLAPDAGNAIHNGADDNASGTAAVLAIAKALSANPPRRSVVACLFAGEEMGLLGSAAYVKKPALPVDRTVAMLNLDMVGRLRDRKLQLFGMDTAPELRPLVAAINDDRFQLSMNGDGYGPSDHTSFYAAGVPVVFLFTGAHDDYHRPSDDADRLEIEGLSQIAAFTTDLARALADADARPTLQHAPAPPPAADSPREGGYGAYFGSIPDFTENPEPGVRITGVREGSPAADAGLKAGDVIVRFAGFEIRNLHDLTYALRARRPGDEVEVTFRREGREQSAKATLRERK